MASANCIQLYTYQIFNLQTVLYTLNRKAGSVVSVCLDSWGAFDILKGDLCDIEVIYVYHSRVFNCSKAFNASFNFVADAISIIYNNKSICRENKDLILIVCIEEEDSNENTNLVF